VAPRVVDGFIEMVTWPDAGTWMPVSRENPPVPDHPCLPSKRANWSIGVVASRPRLNISTSPGRITTGVFWPISMAMLSPWFWRMLLK
jgi:hypothetical protein